MAENCAGVICHADNLLFRDGSADYSTYWYTFEFNGNKYKINHRSIVDVMINDKLKSVPFKEAIDNDYDIVEESLEKFKA